MKEQMEQLKMQLESELSQAADLVALDNIRVKYLGKKDNVFCGLCHIHLSFVEPQLLQPVFFIRIFKSN